MSIDDCPASHKHNNASSAGGRSATRRVSPAAQFQRIRSEPKVCMNLAAPQYLTSHELHIAAAKAWLTSDAGNREDIPCYAIDEKCSR